MLSSCCDWSSLYQRKDAKYAILGVHACRGWRALLPPADRERRDEKPVALTVKVDPPHQCILRVGYKVRKRCQPSGVQRYDDLFGDGFKLTRDENLEEASQGDPNERSLDFLKLSCYRMSGCLHF